jgi:hypothetical protein
MITPEEAIQFAIKHELIFNTELYSVDQQPAHHVDKCVAAIQAAYALGHQVGVAQTLADPTKQHGPCPV